MRAKDLVQVFDVYNYNGIEINIGNKDRIDFIPVEGTRLKCQKEDIFKMLDTMSDNEELFGVPKSFLVKCIEETQKGARE